MSFARRWEVWMIDLGMAAKPRPALLLSIAYRDNERAIVTYVPRTLSARGTRFEVPHNARGFEAGAFDAQGLGGVPPIRLIRRLATLDRVTLSNVESAVRSWLGLP